MTLQIDLLPKIQMPPLSSVSSSSFRALCLFLNKVDSF